MGDDYMALLKAFGFKEMQLWIATMSTLLFSANLLGGILAGLAFVNSNSLTPRPLKDRISFRLFIMGEVLLFTFIFFYHAFMIEDITLSHTIYWISASIMMPLLAIIGSQTIQVVFSGRVKAKEEALKRKQQAERAKRAQEMDAGPGANPAERAMAARKAKSN
ncbi:MAG TPA: hypothetical protein VIN57_07130 [Magnetovibrio sp.]